MQFSLRDLIWFTTCVVLCLGIFNVWALGALNRQYLNRIAVVKQDLIDSDMYPFSEEDEPRIYIDCRFRTKGAGVIGGDFPLCVYGCYFDVGGSVLDEDSEVDISKGAYETAIDIVAPTEYPVWSDGDTSIFELNGN